MSVLDLMEVCARARTIAGLEHALASHLDTRVELVSESRTGIRLRAGAWFCRVKTRAYSAETLRRVLDVAIEHIEVLARVADLNRNATRDSEVLRDEVRRFALPGEVVAASPELRRIFHDLVPLVARQDTTVLIRGETGTGKEVVARRLHALSARSHRPFLAVNCGALPENLVESALFGHERGAFTGAERSQPGLFERADGGTLFLDEIGDLPLHAQVKLLRVLQDGEVERLGATERKRVDVRVIAATNRPLESMMQRERFRADLYYRLNVFPIEVPPLRARPRDLEALAAAIVRRLAGKQLRAPPRISPAVLARLRAHQWPGNARELENVLERAMLISDGEVLVLPPGFERDVSAAPSRVETFREASKRAIQAALSACDGRIYGKRGAAKLLGLRPSTLQSKMLKLRVTATTRRRSS